MSNFKDKITLQYEKELVKNGIDFDNPKDVQYLYNWAKNKEKECDKLKKDIEGLVGVLEEVVIWDNERIEFHNINDKSQKIIHTELKKHKQS